MDADASVRAALREAGNAARLAFIRPGCCMEGTGCEMPPCHCSQVAAAAAVAAFHRKLGGVALEMLVLRSDTDAAEELAAAVERAARGGEG